MYTYVFFFFSYFWSNTTYYPTQHATNPQYATNQCVTIQHDISPSPSKARHRARVLPNQHITNQPTFHHPNTPLTNI